MKKTLYYARSWLSRIVTYPQKTISLDETYSEYWVERGRGTTAALSDWQKDRSSIIAARATHGAVIADFGCGDGAMLKHIGELTDAKQLIGYDIEPQTLSIAHGLGIETHELSAEQAVHSYENLAEADYYLACEVLEHVPFSEKLLAALVARSRKGVFFSVPNTGFLVHRFRLFFGKVPAQWMYMPNEHVRFWTVVDMRWWLRTLGYQQVEIIPYRGIPVLNRLWPNLCAEGVVVFIRQ
ncbi:MAG: methyltransferase domain-containing protein [Patescibacteria group bacterium]